MDTDDRENFDRKIATPPGETPRLKSTGVTGLMAAFGKPRS